MLVYSHNQEELEYSLPSDTKKWTQQFYEEEKKRWRKWNAEQLQGHCYAKETPTWCENRQAKDLWKADPFFMFPEKPTAQHRDQPAPKLLPALQWGTGSAFSGQTHHLPAVFGMALSVMQRSADPNKTLQGKLTDHQHTISSSAGTQCPLPAGPEDWGQCFAVWERLRMSACEFSMAHQHLHQQHFTGLNEPLDLEGTLVFTVTLPPIQTYFPLLHCTMWCQ